MSEARAGRSRALLLVGTGAVAIALVVVAWRWRTARGPRTPAMASFAPLPRAVTVEVLNSGKVTGAARVGTILLRHAGLDVVDYGDAGESLTGRSHNQVLVRRSDTTGAGRVVEALGGADIIDAPDPSRLVDLTVLLGKDFSPPRARR
jgi:hypothetical protein